MNELRLTLIGLLIGIVVSCQSGPQQPDSLYQTGRQAHISGRLQTAQRYYKKALAQKRNHVHARKELGDVYLKRGWPDRAIKQYTKALDTVSHQEPSTSFLMDLHRSRGQAYAQTDRYKQALQDLNRVLENKSEDVPGRNLRGEIHRRMGNLDLALSDFQSSLKTDSAQNLPGHMGVVRVLIDREDWKPAKKKINVINNRWPDLPSVHLLRALIHRELGDPDRMMSDLKKYLSLTNTDVSQKDMEKALNDLAEQIESNR